MATGGGWLSGKHLHDVKDSQKRKHQHPTHVYQDGMQGLRGLYHGEATLAEQAPNVANEAKTDLLKAAEQILLELKKIELDSKLKVFTAIDREVLEKVLAQVRNKSAYICVAGRYNVGKSTLINALLRADILPCSRDAETAVTVYVTKHPARQDVSDLYSRSLNGEEKMVCFGVDKIRKHLSHQNSLQRSGSKVQDKEFVIKTTSPIFSKYHDLEDGLTKYLVDLPGSNEVCQEKLADIASLNVKSATAILYVMSYHELSNDQDFTALKTIYEQDRDIFVDGRLMIAVTQYDKFYEGDELSSELTVDTVQKKVVEKIEEVLKPSKPVERELVIPISGMWACQARRPRFTEGFDRQLRRLRSAIQHSKEAKKADKDEDVSELSFDQCCAELEKTSRIAVLEAQMKKATKNMCRVWKKSIAKNCESLIGTARAALDPQLKKFAQELKEAKEIDRLCKKVINTTRQNPELLEKFKCCYNLDTTAAAGDRLNQEIDELITAFVTQVQSKKKSENYLGADLKEDVQYEFQKHAEERMQEFIRRIKFDKCQQALQAAIDKMTEKCDRLETKVTSFVKKYPEYHQTQHEDIDHRTGESPSDFTRDMNSEELENLYVPDIQITFWQWVKLLFSRLTFHYFTVDIVNDEILKDLSIHLRDQVRTLYDNSIKKNLDRAVQFFFRLYCERVKRSVQRFEQHLECLKTINEENEEMRKRLKEQVQKLKNHSRYLSDLAAESLGSDV